jgi:hypothetical protein
MEEVKGLEVQELGDEGATFSDVREQDKVRGTGGGGGNRGDWNGGGRGGGGDGEGGPHEEEPPKKKMSTSQKLTLAYAALVGGECFCTPFLIYKQICCGSSLGTCTFFSLNVVLLDSSACSSEMLCCCGY